jgi:hypothetical protein
MNYHRTLRRMATTGPYRWNNKGTNCKKKKKKELDVWDDHAVHCTSGGDVAIVGHITPFQIASTPSLSLLVSVSTGNLPGQERHRADLRLHAWKEGRDLYIDIIGSSPLTVANLQHFVPRGAAAHAAQDKQTRDAVLLSRHQPPVSFQTFAFEAFGFGSLNIGLVFFPPLL